MSSLAITAFVFSVISCSEESSRGYLDASDDAFVCSVKSFLEVKRAVFENWFTIPPPPPQKKRTETGGGGDFLKNLLLE